MIGTLSTRKMLLKGSPTNGVGLEQIGTCTGWGKNPTWIREGMELVLLSLDYI
jgi:hypothetical protein